MQHTTSALTTAALGAVLTASTVLAQQLPSPDAARAGMSSSALAETAPNTAQGATNSQVYGMTVTRGARYLMRNGLDYLSYQQYERALKFLREAEARINQQKSLKIKKELLELNDAEVLALKQGIEAAQRGLRKASNAESPYALSDQLRPSDGFTPAKSTTQIVANSNQTKSLTRKAKATPPTPPSLMGSDGGDQGEPIRLTSGETATSDQSAMTNIGPLSLSSNTTAAFDSSSSEGPMKMPETPEIPIVSQLPDLTEANGSERPILSDDQNTVNQASKPNAVSSLPTLVLVPAPSSVSIAQDRNLNGTAQVVGRAVADLPPCLEQKPAVARNNVVTTTEISPLQTQTADPTPTTPPVIETSTDPGIQAQPLVSPIPAGNGPAPSAVAITPASSPDLVASGSTARELTPTTTTSSTSNSIPKNPVVDVQTVPSSATVRDVPQPSETDGIAHKETEDAMPTSTPSAVQPAPVTKPTTIPDSVTASSDADDELPPLPADLSRFAPDVPVMDAPNAQPAPALVPVVAQDDNELPPLPADLGSTPASVEIAIAPAQTLVAPVIAPASTMANNQPVQVREIVPVHNEGAPSPALPTGIGERSVPTSLGLDGSAPTLSPISPTAVSPAGSRSVAVPTSINTEQPLLGSNASTVPTTPVSPSYPTTNPNLDAPPVTIMATGVETPPDMSSLPSAIRGRALASSGDAFIPDRPNAPSTLKPEHQREIERIARTQEDEMRRQAQNPPQPTSPPRDTMASDLRTQTQMDISRAPSPAEARPIKAIPVPEDWVPLAPRNWAPQRKYWAAAATCHLPLYFQDPVLERYGHSVEQFVGPVGRFLTYPVDDPTQSTQRNQLLQPFFSAGLMGLQIVAWPYNLIMDPPWEAQYDLGYYRPGDNIPTDTYWLPLHGYGPPLRGSNY